MLYGDGHEADLVETESEGMAFSSKSDMAASLPVGWASFSCCASASQSGQQQSKQAVVAEWMRRTMIFKLRRVNDRA